MNPLYPNWSKFVKIKNTLKRDVFSATMGYVDMGSRKTGGGDELYAY
jgi:hypothetical protein